MDKYRRVEKPRREEQTTQVEANEIRITQQGKVRSYISYANGLFAEKSERRVVLKAMGNAISKAVTVAEILKHRVANLHQVTRISSIETVDVYEPLEEGLDRIETTRHIPGISIQLSLDELDRDDPGYQSPIPQDQVTAGSPSFHDGREFRKSGGHSRRSGRNGGRGGEAEPVAEEVIEEVKVETDQQTPGEEGTATNSTPTTRGKRGKGRGRSGSNGGRNRKSHGRTPAEEGNEQAAASTVEKQIESETPPASSNRKNGRGRKAKRVASNDEEEKTAGEGEEGDERRENGQVNGQSGKGRSNGRSRGRGRGRWRGGRGESNGRDGNAASAATDDATA